MFTWPLIVLYSVLIIAVCFHVWAITRYRLESTHLALSTRAFQLEERKFEVWKLNQQGSTPEKKTNPPGKVHHLFGRGPHRGGTIVGDSSPPTPERMDEIMLLVREARDMPEAEARAFLASHGIDGVEFVRDDPGADGA